MQKIITCFEYFKNNQKYRHVTHRALERMIHHCAYFGPFVSFKNLNLTQCKGIRSRPFNRSSASVHSKGKSLSLDNACKKSSANKIIASVDDCVLNRVGLGWNEKKW